MKIDPDHEADIRKFISNPVHYGIAINWVTHITALLGEIDALRKSLSKEIDNHTDTLEAHLMLIEIMKREKLHCPISMTLENEEGEQIAGAVLPTQHDHLSFQFPGPSPKIDRILLERVKEDPRKESP